MRQTIDACATCAGSGCVFWLLAAAIKEDTREEETTRWERRAGCPKKELAAAKSTFESLRVEYGTDPSVRRKEHLSTVKMDVKQIDDFVEKLLTDHNLLWTHRALPQNSGSGVPLAEYVGKIPFGNLMISRALLSPMARKKTRRRIASLR